MTQTAPARVSGNFVVLRADSLRLLLPQQDVGAAEHVEGAVRPAGPGGLFEIGSGAQARTVVALSGRMEPLPALPPDRFVLTRLKAGDADLSFAWNEARVLIDAQFDRFALPAAMRVPGAPIEGYVEHEGELLLCTTASHVVAAAVAAQG